MKKLSYDLDETWHRLLSHGKSGTGKSYFLGTWPRLVVFCAKAEGGAVTFQTMDKNDFYDEVRPEIYVVETFDDVKSISKIAAKEVAAGALSIGLDSGTFISQIVENNIGGKGQQKWGNVLEFMSELRDELHALPAHVLWTAGTEDSQRILMRGSFSSYLGHSVSFLFYHTVAVLEGRAEFQVHTSPTSGYLARTRLRNIIPSPLTMIVEDPENPGGFIRQNSPNYKAIEQALQLAKD